MNFFAAAMRNVNSQRNKDKSQFQSQLAECEKYAARAQLAPGRGARDQQSPARHPVQLELELSDRCGAARPTNSGTSPLPEPYLAQESVRMRHFGAFTLLVSSCFAAGQQKPLEAQVQEKFAPGGFIRLHLSPGGYTISGGAANSILIT